MLDLIGYMPSFFNLEMSLCNQCQVLHSSSLQGIINTAFVHVKIVLLTLLLRINLHILFHFSFAFAFVWKGKVTLGSPCNPSVPGISNAWWGFFLDRSYT